MWIEDRNRTIIHVDPAFAKSLGRAPEDILGQRADGFLGLDPLADLGEAHDPVHATSPSHCAFDFVCPDGGRVSFTVCISPLQNSDGECMGFLATGSEESDASAVTLDQWDGQPEDASWGLAIVRAEGGLIDYAGRSFAKMHGYTLKELNGAPLNILLQGDGADEFQPIAEALNEKGHAAFDTVSVRKDGSRFSVELKVHLIRTRRDGRPFYVVYMADLTERSRDEKARRAAARMEAVATLAGGIAHDFNNLMVGVLGNASLLKMKLGDNNACVERLTEIESAGRDAGKLAQQVLAFARGGKYRPRVVSLNRLVDDAAVQLTRVHPKARIAIQEFEPSIWNAEADAAQLTEAIHNILLNAIDATSDGGDINVRTDNVEVGASMAADTPGLEVGNYIRLTVEDTGCGMAQETLDCVYEPYFTTKKDARGLGMAAVYGISKNHQGAIHGESRLGEGTRFDLYLPATKAEADETSVQTPQEVRGTETVLIVEDEEMVASVSRNVLEHYGYAVLLACNGREAVEMTQEYGKEIDIVLLDMAMPVMGGAEAFPLLQAARPALKVILCSGYDLDESAQRLIDAGASAFVQKPFGPVELCQEIRKALDN